MNEGIEINQLIKKIIVYVDFIIFNYIIPSLKNLMKLFQ